MVPSDNLRRLHEAMEGREHDAYRDSGGVLTIGIGHTNEARTRAFTAGERWDDSTIDTVWRLDVSSAAAQVSRALPNDCPQGVFDAMVDLVFNIGPAPLMGRVGRLAAQGRYGEARPHVLDWHYARVKGKLVPLLGLIRRRILGYVVWGGGDWRPIASAPCNSDSLAPFNAAIAHLGLRVLAGPLRIQRT